MKKLLLLIACAVMFVGCGCSTSRQTEDSSESLEKVNVNISMQLYDELFRIIELNDTGEMPVSEFKTQADKLKKRIDANDWMLTDRGKALVKAHGNKLLNELTLRKMERDN